jgi:hypothetical protein
VGDEASKIVRGEKGFDYSFGQSYFHTQSSDAAADLIIVGEVIDERFEATYPLEIATAESQR